MPRPATGHTFIARVRIPRKEWDALEQNVGDGVRAIWIRGFVEALNRDARTWLAVERIAKARGESVWDVVVGALKRYVARHKHLLDDAEDE